MPAVRAKLLADQGGKCGLCQDPVLKGEAVLDHDHVTGEVRGVLHRGCNAMLGKLENGLFLYKLADPKRLARFLSRIIQYRHESGAGVLYPTFRNAKQKRELRNKRARAKRAKEKACE